MKYEKRRDLLLLWTGLLAGFFIAVPSGWHGVLGWYVVMFPILCWTTRIPTSIAYFIGFSGLLACAVVSGIKPLSLELAGVVLSLLIGLVIAKPIRETTPALKTESESLQRTCRREMARARRYNRSLGMLRAQYCEPSENSAADLTLLRDTIANNLPIYCDVFLIENEIVVLVPELGADAANQLTTRLVVAVEQAGLKSVVLGTANFPSDGYTANALLKAAESTRTKSSLNLVSNNTSVPEHENAIANKLSL